ncbi:MAG TPA: hypothetical protein PK668_09075 [Myxococcota bacterium]|nr:hypothetical protein [Myxococcota bacterium]HRY92868.1 hypothetical protein [Myxococcota bacterium]HSA20764.1 hypothetical protein [Myxococcota bacterium]
MRGALFSSVCVLACCAGSCAPVMLEVIELVPAEARGAPTAEAMAGVDAHVVYLLDAGWVHPVPDGTPPVQGMPYALTHESEDLLRDRAATESHGQVVVRHLGPLLSLDAAVVKADGRRVALGTGDVFTKVVRKEAVPDKEHPLDLLETTLVFPGLEPGDRRWYRYMRRDADWEWAFQAPDGPVLFSRFVFPEAHWGSQIKMHFEVRNPAGLAIEERRHRAAGTVASVPVIHYRSFTARDLPAVEPLPGALPVGERQALLRVYLTSTSIGLPNLGRFYHRWLTRDGNVPYGFDVLAANAAGQARVELDKARRLHDWLKKELTLEDGDGLGIDFPYLDAKPLALGSVVQGRRVSAVEAAAILWALLRALDVPARPVLTTRRGWVPAGMDIPSLRPWSHVLLALRDGTLIDPSDSRVPFGRIGARFEGRPALYLDGRGVELKALPRSQAKDNRFEREVALRVEDSGDLTGSVVLRFVGHPATRVRRDLGREAAAKIEELARARILALARDAEVQHVEVSALEGPLEAPVEIRAEVRLRGLAEGARTGPRPIALGSLLSLGDAGEGLTYAFSARLRFELSLPVGLRLVELPRDGGAGGPDGQAPIRYASKASPGPEGRGLRLERSLELHRTDLPAEEAARLEALREEIASLEASPLVLAPAAGAAE